MNDPAGRVSDVERDEAVASLRDDLLAGRLTLDEFSERVGAAYQARTGLELAVTRHGLPAPQSPPPAPAPASQGVQRARRRSRFTLAVFGAVSRRGRFRLPGWSGAAAVFADLNLDLREAEVEGPRAVVLVLVVFGNIDILVPEGVDVDVGGIVVFGSRDEWGHDSAGPGGPSIHVRCLAVFGVVDVWRVPPHLHGSAAQVVRQLGRQEGHSPERPGAAPEVRHSHPRRRRRRRR